MKVHSLLMFLYNNAHGVRNGIFLLFMFHESNWNCPLWWANIKKIAGIHVMSHYPERWFMAFPTLHSKNEWVNRRAFLAGIFCVLLKVFVDSTLIFTKGLQSSLFLQNLCYSTDPTGHHNSIILRAISH